MDCKFDIQDLNVYWGGNLWLKEVSLKIPACQILGIIGPAGSGKTTFLRSLDRMNELEPDCKAEGRVLLDGEDIYASGYDAVTLRKKVGMVFALPVALPMSIYENIVYGPKLKGICKREELNALVEESLGKAFLWNEVKDRLNTSALKHSARRHLPSILLRRPKKWEGLYYISMPSMRWTSSTPRSSA